MSQTASLLELLRGLTNTLALAATEAEILAAVGGYLKSQQPRMLGLLYLDTVPRPVELVLVARQFYSTPDENDPPLNEHWLLADYLLSDIFHTNSKSMLLIEDTAHDPRLIARARLVRSIRWSNALKA